MAEHSDIDAAGDAAAAADDDVTARIRAAWSAHEAGDLTGARAGFEAVLARAGDNVDALHGLGLVARSEGNSDEARQLLARAAEAAPNRPTIQYNYANMLYWAGYYTDAVAVYDRAAALRPREPRIHFNRASALRKVDRVEDAIECYQTVLTLLPDYPAALRGLGDAQRALKRHSEAVTTYQRLYQQAPDDPETHWRLGEAYKKLAMLKPSRESHEKALRRDPSMASVWLSAIFLMHYMPDVTAAHLYKHYRAWAQRHVVTEAEPPAVDAQPRSPDNPLTVGLIADGRAFGAHPGLGLRLAGLEHLPAHGIRLVVYSDGEPKNDALTDRMRAVCAGWRQIEGLSDDEAAALIRSDKVDILTCMVLPAESRPHLFAKQPAPVQSLWGGIGTTGIEAIDWIIADAISVPEGEESCYSEHVYRMPGDYVVYTFPPDLPEVGPLPARGDGAVTFGCFNNPTKISAEIMDIWAEILKALPESQLLLKGDAFDFTITVERTRTSFHQRGVGDDQLVIEGWSQHRSLLERYNSVDICLDPRPYSGGLTTCEALAMGVPVLTYPAPTFTGRHAATHLANAGLSDWIATSKEDYVAKAQWWATHTDELAALRARLREQITRSRLCDGRRFAADLAGAFRHFWEAAGGTAPGITTTPAAPASPAGASPISAAASTAAAATPEGLDLTIAGDDVSGRIADLGQILARDPGADDVRRRLDALLTALYGLRKSGQTQAAAEGYTALLQAYRHALDTHPDSVELRIGLGHIQAAVGRLSKAVGWYRGAVARAPDSGEAHYALGHGYKMLGMAREAFDCFDAAVAKDPDHAAAWRDRLALAPYVPGMRAADLLTIARAAAPQVPEPLAANQPPAPADRPLRVGLVAQAGAFSRHPGLWLRLSALEALDPATVQLTIYADGTGKEDDFTQRLAARATAWRRLAGLSDDAAARTIAADGMDLLVSMVLPAESRMGLFARRPAPVQALWGGAGTSGLTAMDWLIADPVSVPDGEDACYTERIYRLPDNYLCLTPPDDAPAVAELPAGRDGAITFGCFNNPLKVNPETVALWARVLDAIPDSRLLLRGQAYQDGTAAARTRQLFTQHGIAEDRIQLGGPLPHGEMLRAYHEVDIALDPWPYSGGLTTCEALWMGVPVITLPAPTFPGRHAATHLTCAGLGDWIAADSASYVALAADWAAHRDALAALRATLRARVAASPLCDARRFAGHLTQAFRAMAGVTAA